MNAREMAGLLDLAAPPKWGTARVLAAARNVEDLRRAFLRRVPRAVADFVDGGAEDEVTLRRNREAFARVVLTPRQFQGVAATDLRTELFGCPSSLPVALAPCGAIRVVHAEGELAVARAAAAAGVIYTVPSMGSTTLEEIARAVPPGTPQWFQLYLWRDRGLTRDLVVRAREAGYRAMVVTLDTPVSGARERDIANGMNIPPKLTRAAALDAARHPGWWWRFIQSAPPSFANVTDRTPSAADTTTMQYVAEQFDPGITWDDLSTVLDAWDGPVIAKGVLCAADAVRAVDAGATGIIVSNHGGRQLDRAPATFDVLASVLEAVGDRAEVLLDSGVRRGGDVAAAVALGARGCLVGRPYLYGLGAGGEAGVARMLELLSGELARTLTLMGVATPGELDASFLGAVAEHQL
ncbi:alpha-hydroxy-acid oxidizing protein [Baekduia soli]|uniref:Alpha-hydroxy-acid oxidizing protein n=1 Tax=Baekduia soli TaxID=496014 RepID=A0A5B8U9Q3_9ACTN|nr:alpha-hydroxy acid oxidase [Baekduia soli]QEC49765.1 alpha-hydroxy-acid oxidizing protein [Baekduia soli]